MKRISLILFLMGTHAFGYSNTMTPDLNAAHRALVNLTEKPEMGITVPITNSKSVFKNLWRTWKVSQSEKSKIANLSDSARFEITLEHYGLVENPRNPELPLGFVERNGFFAMNCLACHAGQIMDKTVIGLPNRNIDLRSLYHDISLLQPLGGQLLRIAAQNLGPDRGLVTTFGMEQQALLFRDKKMNLKLIPNNWGSFENTQSTVPPWWNLPYRTHLFSDSVLPVTPRIFVASASSVFESGKKFRGYEDDVADAFELAKATVPPMYPAAVDRSVAAVGQQIFTKTCSGCHGNYDSEGVLQDYPNKTIKVSRVGTDALRTTVTSTYLNALDFLADSWVAKDFNVPAKSPGGYIAPPLVGVWSSAPYFHNGSVPTLWDVLNPDLRPTLWKQSENPRDYDLVNVGLKYDRPLVIDGADKKKNWKASLYYDTSKAGHGSAGHSFADDLSEQEKLQLLEYLKLL